ncbi:MAG: hypothetical protein H0V61_01240 [Chitinophagales bacterium]|nr:hypothetical protein [Chitinophagales bacterium]
MRKLKNITLILGLLLQMITAHVFAQHNLILGNFSLFQSNGKVYLNWYIVSGSSCNGIQIYRSTDSVMFTSWKHRRYLRQRLHCRQLQFYRR